MSDDFAEAHAALGHVAQPHRRATAPAAEVAAFIEAHRDWAFEASLRRTWLDALAERGRWSELLTYYEGGGDTELACHEARARIILGRTKGVGEDIRRLWAVGQCQPKACDVPFIWMINTYGVSEVRAWQRIFLAIEADARALVRYLGRFVTAAERRWLDDWRSLSRGGHARIERMVTPYDIAPTLSAYLGVKPPSGAVGAVLPEVLKR